MNSNKVKVQVDTHRDKGASDPLKIYYEAICQKGKENSFILESLSGPSRDRRATIVGVDPIFSVEVHEEYALLKGQTKVCDFLMQHVRDKAFSILPMGEIALPDRESVWDLLRELRNPFELPRTRQTSLAYFGYFAYDTIRFIEDIPSKTEDTFNQPIIALTVYQTLFYFHANGTKETLISNCDLWDAKKINDYSQLLSEAQNSHSLPQIKYPSKVSCKYSVEKNDFEVWVEKALEHIRLGDIYQIQLGHEVEIESPLTPFEVYRELRRTNPSPYMYLSNQAGIDLIGASPELFVRQQDGLVEMRPIAGTVGKKPGVEVKKLIQAMTQSEKERSEHIMLVDLCRNDIGRICQPSSLSVDELMLVEEYSHLYHMVSNVSGLLRSGNDAFDIFKATFPAGTMTGAPKVRAMELIEEMEQNRRGVYAGAVGLIGFNDSINTALCIRSAVHRNGRYFLRASAGVVADSLPEREWLETFYKMSSVYSAVTGQEMIK